MGESTSVLDYVCEFRLVRTAGFQAQHLAAVLAVHLRLIQNRAVAGSCDPCECPLLIHTVLFLVNFVL